MNNIIKPDTVRTLKMFWKQNRPKIEILGGVAGTGLSMYLSNRSSMHLPKLVEETKNQMKQAERNLSGKELKAEKAKLRKKMVLGLVKLYGPSAGIYIASILGIIDGMNQQDKRLIGMSAALALSAKEMADYRKMTAEKIGVEAENDLYNRMKTETVETTVVNPKNGEEKKTKTTVKKFEDVGFNHGLYSFKFGKGYSTFYNENENPDYVVNFLIEREQHINDVIIPKDGSITTRDILHRIGITDDKILKQPGKPNNNKPLLQFLNNSGYIYDPEHPFSFGLTDEVVKALRNGEDVYLTMNIEPDIVTGIYQKIKKGENNGN